MEVRAATARDVQAVTETLADAFGSDPVWSWAFPDNDHLQVWWRFWVAVAVPHGRVRIANDAGAVSVWIPPGEHECAPEDEAHVPPLVRALGGARADAILETLGRFDANHPHDLPHYYLSLLATASAQRGQGLGMALLHDGLAQIDDHHLPAYLESSNPVNLERYERVGFEPIGEFSLPEGNVVVTTMWRPPA